jgi:hypothetical protein
MFEIKTKHDIMMAPMREYIEERLRKLIIKITKPTKQEMVATIMPPLAQQPYIKEASSRK